MKTKIAILISLIIFIILLGGLLATIFLIRERQGTLGRAEGSASLSWSATPATLAPGATTSVAILANSPSVAIDAVQFQIAFDSFDVVEVDNTTGKLAVAPSTSFPTIIQDPTLVGKELRFAYGASTNLAEVKGSNITVTTITLKAKSSGSAKLTINYSAEGGTRISGGPAGNLLAASGVPQPLTITVTGLGGTTGTPPIGSPLTPAVSTPGVTIPPRAQSAVDKPVCRQLSTQPSTGPSPLTVAFTGQGSASAASGSAILASEFSFGEGQNQLVEKNYGSAASETVSHTYNAAGTYQVFVRFRSGTATWSEIPSACTGQVVVSAGQATAQTHYACQGNSCVAVAGGGADECNPSQENVCKAPKPLDELPKSGKLEPIIWTTLMGILILFAGAVVLR